MDKKKIILIVAVAVVAVAAIIAGAVFGFSSLFDGGKNDTAQVSSQVDSNDDAPKGELTVNVASVEGEKGKIINVPVTVGSNPGFMSSLMAFEYDSKVVKYVGYAKGDVIADYQFEEDGNTVKFLNLENEDTSKTGTLFTLKFEVVGEKGTSSDIKINIVDVINYNEKDIQHKTQNGKVTVK